MVVKSNNDITDQSVSTKEIKKLIERKLITVEIDK